MLLLHFVITLPPTLEPFMYRDVTYACGGFVDGNLSNGVPADFNMSQELHDYTHDYDVNFLHVIEDNIDNIHVGTVESETSAMSFKEVYASIIRPVISTVDELFTRSIWSRHPVVTHLPASDSEIDAVF